MNHNLRIRPLRRCGICLLLLLFAGDLSAAGGSARPVSVWPLYYHRSSADSGVTDIIWPVYHHEWNRSWQRYSIRPLVFETEGDSAGAVRKTSVLWPLARYRRDARSKFFNLFPVYWYYNSPDRRYNNLFPVYFDGKGPDYSYRMIWPFYGVCHRGSYTEHSILFPFFRFGRDSETRETNIHAFWPIANFHRTREYLSYRVWPLYWYMRGVENSGGLVFPYYWRNGPGYQARGILPLWYMRKGPEYRTDAVLPLYFDYRSPRARLRFITPVYSSWTTAKTSFHTFLPLYYDFRGESLGIKAALPFYCRFRHESFGFRTIFPFYFSGDDSLKRSSWTYYFPFYGVYRNGDFISRQFLLFPLYSVFRDSLSQKRSLDVFWPLFHHGRSPDSRTLRILPLYWHSRKPGSTTTVALPCYFSHESDSFRAKHWLPFYGVHERSPGFRRKFFLGPVYVDTRDSLAGVARQDLLYPLFSRQIHRDWTRSWSIPFHFSYRDSTESHIAASLALLPPYYLHSKWPRGEFRHLWPFFGRYRSGSYHEKSMVWPFFRFGRDTLEDRSLLNILLYNRSRRKDSVTNWIFPLWSWGRSPKRVFNSSLFLHSYERDSDNTAVRLEVVEFLGMNLFRYARDSKARRHFLCPLYRYESNLSADTLNWTVLWPLPFDAPERSIFRRLEFLWKAISYEQQGPETREFRFLWRLIRKRNTPTSSVFELNPLYYYEAEEEAGSYWAILGGLIGAETYPDGTRKMKYFWFF